MATRTYEVACCLRRGRYAHLRSSLGRNMGPITSLIEAKKLAEKLLHKAHTSVTVTEVIRTAKALLQPKRDAGTFCRAWIGMSCDLDHVHAFEEKTA